MEHGVFHSGQTSSEPSFDLEHVALSLKAGVCLSSVKVGEPDTGGHTRFTPSVHTNFGYTVRAQNVPATIVVQNYAFIHILVT